MPKGVLETDENPRSQSESDIKGWNTPRGRLAGEKIARAKQF